MSDLSERHPEHNIVAERGVLGSILLDPRTLAQVKPILRGPADFWRDLHTDIYRGILTLDTLGLAVDPVILADELDRRGIFTSYGGFTALEEIRNGVPHSANAALYAGLVRECADKRDLRQIGWDIGRDIESNDFTAAQIIARVRDGVATIEDGIADRTWETPNVDLSYPVLPFPLDVLPPSLQRFVLEVAQSVPCPPDYVAVPCLAVAGAAIGRSIALRLKPGWNEEANLWTTIVGPPGTGKTAPVNAATRPLFKIFDAQNRTHAAAVAAAQDSTKPVKMPVFKRTLVSEITTEALGQRLHDNPRGLILVSDELAGLMNGLDQYKTTGGNDREFWLALWSRSSFPIDRKSQEGGVPIYVRAPFQAITGGLQPDKLSTIGTTKDGRRLNDGFRDRFLYSYPNEIAMDWTEQGVDPETEKEWTDAILRLCERPMIDDKEGYERPHYVDFTTEGRKLFTGWFRENCRSMGETDFPSDMKGPYSKMRSYCARLALTLEQLTHAFDPVEASRPRNVGRDAVAGAIRLIEYFDSHYRRVTAFVAGVEGDNPDARDMLPWIFEARPSGRFTLRELRDQLPHQALRASPAPSTSRWRGTRSAASSASCPMSSVWDVDGRPVLLMK